MEILFTTPRWTLNLILLTLVFRIQLGAASSEIQSLTSLSSTNRTLETDWTLESATVQIPNSDITLTTRLFNGQYPGPTLRLKAGDELQVHFTNQLEDQGRPYVHNEMSAPDETNLHFHGLHVSGELPSDDVTYVIQPGDSFDYVTVLPDNHLGGTHWMHPHRHGSTSLQVGGGAFSLIVVEDEEGFVPDQVKNAKEVLFLAHQLHPEEMQEASQQSSDGLWSMSGGTAIDIDEELVTVNGQLNPTITAHAGEWMRFRILWAAWQENTLDLHFDGCEMKLLAKDGVYIHDFPRSITATRIAQGGRADVMVRCPNASSRYSIQATEQQQVVATIQISGDPPQSSDDLEEWTPTYPEYLTDLRTTSVSEGCACQTELDDDTINGQLFEYDTYLHETYLNAVVEREVFSQGHSYHQHVYPFQLISGFFDNTGYIKEGDWHADTIIGEGVVRYQPNVFTGKVMIHCHILEHEDEGMMTVEYVHPISNDNPGTCSCGAPPSVPIALIVGISVGAVACLMVVGFFVKKKFYSADKK